MYSDAGEIEVERCFDLCRCTIFRSLQITFTSLRSLKKREKCGWKCFWVMIFFSVLSVYVLACFLLLLWLVKGEDLVSECLSKEQCECNECFRHFFILLFTGIDKCSVMYSNEDEIRCISLFDDCYHCISDGILKWKVFSICFISLCSLIVALVAGKLALFLTLCGCCVLFCCVKCCCSKWYTFSISLYTIGNHASSLCSASPAVEVNATIRPVSFFAMRICFSTRVFNFVKGATLTQYLNYLPGTCQLQLLRKEAWSFV